MWHTTYWEPFNWLCITWPNYYLRHWCSWTWSSCTVILVKNFFDEPLIFRTNWLVQNSWSSRTMCIYWLIHNCCSHRICWTDLLAGDSCRPLFNFTCGFDNDIRKLSSYCLSIMRRSEILLLFMFIIYNFWNICLGHWMTWFRTNKVGVIRFGPL